MKRLIVSLVILAIAVGISVSGYCVLKTTCDTLVTSLNNIKELALDSSPETAGCADDFYNLWEKKGPLLHMLINHEETKDAELNIERIPPAATEEAYDEVIRLCEETADILLHIKSSSEPLIGNILLIKSVPQILTSVAD